MDRIIFRIAFSASSSHSYWAGIFARTRLPVNGSSSSSTLCQSMNVQSYVTFESIFLYLLGNYWIYFSITIDNLIFETSSKQDIYPINLSFKRFYSFFYPTGYCVCEIMWEFKSLEEKLLFNGFYWFHSGKNENIWAIESTVHPLPIALYRLEFETTLV